MSDTPRTEAQMFWCADDGLFAVGADFAQELERENAALRADNAATHALVLELRAKEHAERTQAVCLEKDNAALRENVKNYETLMTKYVTISEKIVKERDRERAQRLQLQKRVDDTIEWECRCGATDSKGRRDRQYLLDVIESHVQTTGLLRVQNEELKKVLAASDVDPKTKKLFIKRGRKPRI